MDPSRVSDKNKTTRNMKYLGLTTEQIRPIATAILDAVIHTQMPKYGLEEGKPTAIKDWGMDIERNSLNLLKKKLNQVYLKNIGQKIATLYTVQWKHV